MLNQSIKKSINQSINQEIQYNNQEHIDWPCKWVQRLTITFTYTLYFIN